MKRSLIALAALAASGAALAQSSVTLYGRVDLGATWQNTGDSILDGGNGASGSVANRWDIRQGSASRLGFRGTEDLGSGLKANFNLEHRFDPDVGTQSRIHPMWSQAWLGVSSRELGEVRLGRDYNPAWDVALNGDPFGTDTVGRVGIRALYAGYSSTANNGGSGFLPNRMDNLISYRTPNIMGLTGQVAYSAREGNARGNAIGFNLQYQGPQYPLYVGLAYETRTSGNDNDMWIGALGWDFGFLRLIGSYTRATVSTDSGPEFDNDNISLGLTAPLGSGIVKAAVNRFTEEDQGFGGRDQETTKFGLGYEYLLSKRTSIYTDVATSKTDDLASGGGGDGERTNAFDIGIKHNF